jgi:signal recognition particle subunit SRP54
MKMIPGMGKALKGQEIDEKQLLYVEAMISSMSKKERKNPKLISQSSSRRRRVANGSGRSVTEVNRLIQTMGQQTQMMKRMGNMDPSKLNTSNPMAAMQALQQPGKKPSKGKKKKRLRF